MQTCNPLPCPRQLACISCKIEGYIQGICCCPTSTTSSVRHARQNLAVSWLDGHPSSKRLVYGSCWLPDFPSLIALQFCAVLHHACCRTTLVEHDRFDCHTASIDGTFIATTKTTAVPVHDHWRDISLPWAQSLVRYLSCSSGLSAPALLRVHDGHPLTKALRR